MDSFSSSGQCYLRCPPKLLHGWHHSVSGSNTECWRSLNSLILYALCPFPAPNCLQDSCRHKISPLEGRRDQRTVTGSG
jgi:hypothetical protein